MKLFRFSIVVFLIAIQCVTAQNVWQWSVSLDAITSDETLAPPQAYLWIPENCKTLKGIVFTQHNMIERGILEHKKFRKQMTKLGFGEVWVTPKIAVTFNFNNNAPQDFEYMLEKLGEVSGYTEINTIPVIPMGHSALASFPWNFAAYYPNKTLAIISVHGDAPLSTLTGSGQPNPDWGNRNIDGIPGLFIMGEYEWWEDRINPAFKYISKHSNSPITLFADAGHGHFDYSDMLVTYIANYINKAVSLRIKTDGIIPIDVTKGWLMDKWHKDSLPKFSAAPYANYQGDKTRASWVFDKKMAKETEIYYAKSRNKKTQFLGFIQNGDTIAPDLSHANYKLSFTPFKDGITFAINAFFATDSTKIHGTNKHASSTLLIDKITGPVEKINDTLFRIKFDRLGFNNPRRSNTIWLLAHNKGDKKYKSMVQQAELKFPLANTKGDVQHITFLPIDDQPKGVQKLNLQATSDADQQVQFFVKEGPAYIINNELHFTKIPPRSKFPVKVTVVAWQYGIANKIQTAEPVTQSFYISSEKRNHD